MPVNERFLEKAEKLKRELLHRSVTAESDGRELNSGDEVIFDFGNHYVGYVSCELIPSGHHQDAPLYLQFQFAEIREELDSDYSDYNGWISKSWIQDERVHVDILPTVLHLERRYAFRYVKIRVLAASDNYSVRIPRMTADTVSSADYGNVTYPALSETDRRIDEIALRTLHSCMQDVFEDGPKRDRRLWLGDLRLEALANYETFRNYDLVRRCLYLFAGSTLEQGRLASNVFTAPEVECDYQSMFDYALFFINVLWDYYQATGDKETLEDLESVCLRQHELLKECFGSDGLLDMEKAGMVFVDWNFELDKQAAGQAIYIYALNDLIRIEKALNRSVSELKGELADRKQAALKLFDRESGLFVSGEKKQISVASQVWMILAEVLPVEEGRDVIRKINEHPEAVKLNSPYAYHHLVQAMINVGLKDEAHDLIQEYWGGMAARGSNTFWEIYNPENPEESPYGGLVVHSFCHAWSCTPAYFYRKYFNE